MAGDNHTPEPIRYQVTLVHACPPDDPRGLILEPAHDKGVHCVRHPQGRVQFFDLNSGSVRGDEVALTIRKSLRIVGENA